MKKFAMLVVIGAVAAALAEAQNTSGVRREILGLQLSMSEPDVEKRLKEIGTFVRDERKRQQIWTTRDDTFSHVAIGFDKEGHLRYVTAVARSDDKAKRMRYEEVGPLAEAKQVGDPAVKNFNFIWSLPKHENQPETQVIARGRHETFLDTFTLKRNESEAPESEDEKERD